MKFIGMHDGLLALHSAYSNVSTVPAEASPINQSSPTSLVIRTILGYHIQSLYHSPKYH